MDTDSSVLVTGYTDKRLNPIEGSYSKDVMGQMIKTATFNDYYYRTSHGITIEELGRALRVLQYWDSLDGNLDFDKETILKKLIYQFHTNGANWWYALRGDTTDKARTALDNGDKYTKAIATIKELFPEILR